MKRDVTQQVLLERQLHHAQKMELVGRFAGGIAHDFNNLLGVILGYGELLRQEVPQSSPLREGIEEILVAADRAGRLTRQLLAFGRKQVLVPQVIDLNAVVADLARMLPRILGEQIAFSTHRGADLGAVVADVGQIEQVIMNLVLNVRDAMPGGGSICVATENREVAAPDGTRLSPIPPGSYVVLSVTDDGSGMDPATQARIFEPFFTTKGIGEGTGLGLATVDGIVGQSGGFVAVQSRIGRGSTFGVYLPRSLAPPSSELAKAAPPASSVAGTETVLLVEDEAGLRQLLQRVLARSGYTVLTAVDAGDAEALLASHPEPIHLLVTDVMLPGARGTDLADTAQRMLGKLKVLLISGYSNEAISLASLAAPSREFLSKPFSLDLLLCTVRTLLDRR
jgi:two-component system cell cycle sensor histidine kinase/response regulator CckA